MKIKHENYLNFTSPDHPSIGNNMTLDKKCDIINVHEGYEEKKNNFSSGDEKSNLTNQENMHFEDGQKNFVRANPWIVKNLEEFLYYCCPECNDKNQSKDNFINHVLTFHPMAKEYLETIEIFKIEPNTNSNICNEKPMDIIIGKYEKETNEFDINNRDGNSNDLPVENYGENNSLEEKSKQLFKCEDCNKSYTALNTLRKHVQSVHEGIKHLCDTCNKSFTVLSNLKKHIKEVHENVKRVKKLQKCEICEKTFPGGSYLKIHIETVHEKLRKYQCKECDKNFAHREAYKSHVRNIHEGSKWKCEFW